MITLDRIIAVRNRKTVYRDGDKCIKVFNEGYSKADVLNEALNQARVENIGLNVPKILEVATIDNKWAIVSEYIKGTTIADLMAKAPTRKDELLRRFVEVQCDILSRTCPQLNDLREKMARKISQANIDATMRYEMHARLNGMPKHNFVCHGDFDPSNVIITDNDEAYILDWAHVTQGNTSADAARTYLRFWLHGDITLASKYLDLFCEMKNTDKKYIQNWMPIVATSQVVKGNEAEREFLISWASVVDYE